MARLPGLKYPRDEYLLALGEAVFNFGLVEQGVVHFVDYTQPGFLASSYDMTAVPIMECFCDIAEGDQLLVEVSKASLNLAVLRNILLHARPIGEDGAEPTLGYAGKEGVHQFELADVRRFSEMCIPVIAFFGDWSAEISERGDQFTDVVEFLRRIDPMIRKWRQRQEKRRR